MKYLSAETYKEYFGDITQDIFGKKDLTTLKWQRKFLVALKEGLNEPFVEEHATLSTLDVLKPSEGEVVHGFQRYIIDVAKKDDPDNDYLTTLCVEDKEWTERRNQGLRGIYYTKNTLKPKYQKLIAGVADDLIQIIDQYVEDRQAEKARKQKELEDTLNTCEIVRSYKNNSHKKNEDIYIDCDVRIKKSGTIVRTVFRNVFDFGAYGYPKRVEGTEEVFERDSWTDDEKTAVNWLYIFHRDKTHIIM